jgi:tRNA(Ile)-lysidine synthase
VSGSRNRNRSRKKSRPRRMRAKSAAAPAEAALSPVAQAVSSVWPHDLWRDCGVLLACSGGADSVALVCAVRELIDAADATTAGKFVGNVMVAHFNHKMRGADSDGDERFVERFAEEQGLLYCSAEYAPPPGHNRLSEESARDARYDYLITKAEQVGARYLVTAHHAEDQAETVLHNLLRGTGLIGLGGMAEFLQVAPSVTLARPLLTVRRRQIIEYLQSRKQTFREDGSNSDTSFTRNRLRQEALPLLNDCVQGDAVEAICRAAEAAREARLELDVYARDLMQDAIRRRGDPAQLELDLSKVAGCNDFQIRSLWRYAWTVHGLPLQRMTAEHWRRLGNLCRPAQPESRTLQLPGDITAERKADCVLLRSPYPPT